MYYYQYLLENSNKLQSIQGYFPQFFGHKSFVNGTTEIVLEYVKGIPYATLYGKNTLTLEQFRKLLMFVDTLHSIHDEENNLPSLQQCKANYIVKLKKRFECKDNYPFSNAVEIQDLCLRLLESHMPKIVSFIHGDLWFSNVISEFNGNLKVFDMKGCVLDQKCTGGDIF